MTLEDKARKEKKDLKKIIARAERIAREGFGYLDVVCPKCGAKPARGFNGRRNTGECRAVSAANSWNTPVAGGHQVRRELATAKKADILRAGEWARADLERIREREERKAAGPHPARRFRCLHCGATPGAPCKRPSGHTVFGGDVHAERRNQLEAELDLAARRGQTLAPVKPVAQPALF